MDRHDLYEFFVYTVGGIAQQGEWERLWTRAYIVAKFRLVSGIDLNTQFQSIRMVILSLLFLSLMLYNYYTSAVVGDLLSIPVKGPSTIKEIIDSPLTLSFEDIAYHKIIFKEYNTTLVREMYKKKVWRKVLLVSL